jgi:hypothetical protein
MVDLGVNTSSQLRTQAYMPCAGSGAGSEAGPISSLHSLEAVLRPKGVSWGSNDGSIRLPPARDDEYFRCSLR